MLFWLIPLILSTIALIVLVVIVVRKIPRLRVINIEETLEAKIKKTKEDIIMERFKRLRSSKLGKASKKIGPVFKKAAKYGRKTVQRLKALENYYEDLKQASERVHATDPEMVKRIMGEAATLVREEKFSEAENRYVEVISHNPKNIEAYEELGRLYVKMKKTDQAKEIFEFILNMRPEDASVLAALGEIAVAENDAKAALGYFERAVAKRPGNPKYLDFMIEAAMAAEELEPARRGIDQLRRVNPENKKLDDFEDRFGALSVTPRKKKE